MKNLQKILKTKNEDYKSLLGEIENSFEIENFFCPRDNKVSRASGFLGEKTKLVTGYADFVLDDESAYELLFDNVKASENLMQKNGKYNAENLCKLVQKTVFDYYGTGRPNDIYRTFVYRNAYNKETDVSVKSFCGTGNSMCLERASLAHNYFLLLGVQDTLVSSDIIINGEKDLHTFNVVEIDGKKYIFDLVCSKILNEKMPNPIMKNLSEDKKYKGESISFISQSGKNNTISYLGDFMENEQNLEMN